MGRAEVDGEAAAWGDYGAGGERVGGGKGGVEVAVVDAGGERREFSWG